MPRVMRAVGSRMALAALRVRGYCAVHVVYPPGSVGLLKMSRWLGLPVFLHWIGTDVLTLDRARGEYYRHVARAHYADSLTLIEELRSFGIDAHLFRLLPARIDAEILPMPTKPAVLAYWPAGRRKFYGGEILDGLATAFPTVQFYVCGSAGDGEPQSPNVTYLGYVADVEPLYRNCSILLRLPEHDSLSAMVLEMLARGRWVIYKSEFPHTERAHDLSTACEAMRRCLGRAGCNERGHAYVREHFSPAAEARRVGVVYRALLNAR